MPIFVQYQASRLLICMRDVIPIPHPPLTTQRYVPFTPKPRTLTYRVPRFFAYSCVLNSWNYHVLVRSC